MADCDPNYVRLHSIVSRLETRSNSCPGLFPLRDAEHWIQLARMEAGASPAPFAEAKTWPLKLVETLWQTLEDFDRHPEKAHASLNRLLSQNSTSSICLVSESAPETAATRLQAIETILIPWKSSCQKAQPRSA
ncbi:MAG: hypothetical protein AAF558_10520 [Verrucomicrobiota bacterium]